MIGTEGHVALHAEVYGLGILLAHLQAHLAVPGRPLPVLVQLGLHNPANAWCIYVGR